jgi:hypothetical protein
MDANENNGNPVTIQEPVRAETQVYAEKSFADFFNKLSLAIDQLRNGPSKADAQQAKRFESYSQAFAGFAQNNVSKPEGFSIGVKTDKAYDDLTKKLIKQKRDRDEETCR